MPAHPHVAKVRKRAEKAGDVETVTTSIDTKGRKQPAKKAPMRPQSTKPADKPASESPDIPKPRDDIGAASNGELARKDAYINKLQAEKRRLEIKIEGLESEIEELRAKLAATGTGGDMSSSEFQTAIKKWEETVETQRGIIARLENENATLRAKGAALPDDGLDIPSSVRRGAS
jgi:predicted RNase H-like nuclease (RuvC/YqgF family)